VRQGQIANPEPRKLPEHSQVLADHVAALDAEQYRDSVLACRALDVGRRGCEEKFAWM
jgi:hypothetical protein